MAQGAGMVRPAHGVHTLCQLGEQPSLNQNFQQLPSPLTPGLVGASYPPEMDYSGLDYCPAVQESARHKELMNTRPFKSYWGMHERSTLRQGIEDFCTSSPDRMVEVNRFLHIYNGQKTWDGDISPSSGKDDFLWHEFTIDLSEAACTPSICEQLKTFLIDCQSRQGSTDASLIPLFTNPQNSDREKDISQHIGSSPALIARSDDQAIARQATGYCPEESLLCEEAFLRKKSSSNVNRISDAGTYDGDNDNMSGDGPALFLLATPDGIVRESVDAKAGMKKNGERCDMPSKKSSDLSWKAYLSLFDERHASLGEPIPRQKSAVKADVGIKRKMCYDTEGELGGHTSYIAQSMVKEHTRRKFLHKKVSYGSYIKKQKTSNDHRKASLESPAQVFRGKIKPKIRFPSDPFIGFPKGPGGKSIETKAGLKSFMGNPRLARLRIKLLKPSSMSSTSRDQLGETWQTASVLGVRCISEEIGTGTNIPDPSFKQLYHLLLFDEDLSMQWFDFSSSTLETMIEDDQIWTFRCKNIVWEPISDVRYPSHSAKLPPNSELSRQSLMRCEALTKRLIILDQDNCLAFPSQKNEKSPSSFPQRALRALRGANLHVDSSVVSSAQRNVCDIYATCHKEWLREMHQWFHRCLQGPNMEIAVGNVITSDLYRTRDEFDSAADYEQALLSKMLGTQLYHRKSDALRAMKHHYSVSALLSVFEGTRKELCKTPADPWVAEITRNARHMQRESGKSTDVEIWMRIGQEVEAIYDAQTDLGFYSGIVTAINTDNTYAVKFFDGDVDLRVHPKHIRIPRELEIATGKTPVHTTSQNEIYSSDEYSEASHKTKSTIPHSSKLAKRHSTPRGEDLVGCHIKILWSPDQLWYYAEVVRYDSTSRMHTIHYQRHASTPKNEYEIETLSLDGRIKFEVIQKQQFAQTSTSVLASPLPSSLCSQNSKLTNLMRLGNLIMAQSLQHPWWPAELCIPAASHIVKLCPPIIKAATYSKVAWSSSRQVLALFFGDTSFDLIDVCSGRTKQFNGLTSGAQHDQSRSWTSPNNPMMRKIVKVNKSGEVGVVCDTIGKGWISIRLFSNNSIVKGRQSDITVLEEDKQATSEAIQRASALLLV